MTCDQPDENSGSSNEYVTCDMPKNFVRIVGWGGLRGVLKCYYCTILINSAGPVTRYAPAKILVSALYPDHHYLEQIFGKGLPEARNFGYSACDPPEDFGTSPE